MTYSEILFVIRRKTKVEKIKFDKTNNFWQPYSALINMLFSDTFWHLIDSEYGSQSGHSICDREELDTLLLRIFISSWRIHLLCFQGQSVVGLVLSTLRYDSLFDYSSELEDPLARKIVYKHHCRLAREIQPRIEQRNKCRLQRGHLTYPYLIPRWITNGVQT